MSHKVEPTAMGEAAASTKARRAELLENKAKRQERLEQEAEARQLEELELEEKYEGEIGRRGLDFEIVNTPHGIVVLKLGEYVLYKRFQSAMAGDKDPTPEDVHAFVKPCVVHPDGKAFDLLAGNRPNIALRCANALMVLYGAKEGKDRGKF